MSREATLEARCCALAKRMGVYPIKLGGFVVGLPDRLFLLPDGRVWLVEFKTPEGRLEPRQKFEFERLHELGHPVTICRTYFGFKRDLDKLLLIPRAPKQMRLELT